MTSDIISDQTLGSADRIIFITCGIKYETLQAFGGFESTSYKFANNCDRSSRYGVALVRVYYIMYMRVCACVNGCVHVGVVYMCACVCVCEGNGNS